ncbi:MAG: type VI secretion system-associated FHA domain protein TagH [Proteobacteria bacterium]|nr:type VI secretion system-associated FHA domain protein TagH [Pseudomonadota bacterium]
MIVLAVKTYNGAATEPIEASFDALGGTIGRADSNRLVLPDPDRTISRVHATVAQRSGVFVIEDRGSNPIVVNGSALGKGAAVPLAAGDVVQIGGYLLEVRAAAVAPPAAATRMPASPVPAAGGVIPANWDPLHTGSAALPTSAPAVPAPAPATPMPAAPGGTPSIDDLFGLDDQLPRTDPLPRRMLPDDLGPLLAAAPAPLSRPSALPSTLPPSSPSSPSSAPPPATAGDTRRTPVVSWDGSPRQATIVAAPVSAADGRRAVPTATGGSARPGLRSAGPVSAAAPAHAAAPSSGASPAGAPAADGLLQAFLDGLGNGRAPQLGALTPELMHLLGSLLAESVRGTIDLLHARAVVKNEMRADVTAIRPRQNNPLKFSPTAEVALQHLLTPTVPGFLPAQAAMRDAFQDLRAHELAVMAGVRAALSGLLQRFDPKTLETHLVRKSGLETLLAGGRRAQLWQAYQSLFSQLSAEAEDDFHTLFGRAFLEAYEDHLGELKAADRQPAPTGGRRPGGGGG